MAMHPGISRARHSVRLALAVALVAASILVAAAPASAVPGWALSTNPSPLGPTNGSLRGISCPSATSCFAVGSFRKALAQRWNGTRWSNMLIPSPGPNNILRAVFCPTTSSCLAVGQSGSNLLIERWNGTTWSIVLTSNPPGATIGSLNGVSCRGPADCYAVGSSGTGSVITTLIEHWDGTSWSIVGSPNPGDAFLSELTGVRCPLATMCVAVGFSTTASATRTLAEHWDGTSWSIVASPNGSGSTYSTLSGLVCPSPTSCFALGYSVPSSRKTLIERWNGTSWSITPGPTFPGFASSLSAVKCLSTTDCFAVGTRADNTHANNTLVERWNGTSWSVVASPNSPGGASELNSIWCVSTSSCEAVGDSADSPVLAEHWNGTSWSVDANALGGSQAALEHVACASAGTCFAVGNYSNGSATKTLVERWNGSAWSIVSTPNPAAGSRIAALSGVSCPSATSCYAVGFYETSTFVDKTLVEHWDGTSWSIVTSPNQAGADATTLAALACSSTTRCDAVGAFTSSSTANTFMLHWNGTTWSVASNTRPAGSAGLVSVSCPSTTSCYATGSSISGGTLVQHWNGTTWSVVASPNPSGWTIATFKGVACNAVNSCDAVGWYSTLAGGANSLTLVEHWDGTSWTIVPTPNPGARAELDGIACPSASACYAVGTMDPGGTFAEQWDGTNWSIVPTPNLAGTTLGAYLHGVECQTTMSCFAVGRASTNLGNYTLIEQHT